MCTDLRSKTFLPLLRLACSVFLPLLITLMLIEAMSKGKQASKRLIR